MRESQDSSWGTTPSYFGYNKKQVVQRVNLIPQNYSKKNRKMKMKIVKMNIKHLKSPIRYSHIIIFQDIDYKIVIL